MQKAIFNAEFNRCEFSFPSPRLVAISKLKSQSVLLFTYNWIHIFLKGISTMYKMPCPRFELELLIPFPMIQTFTPQPPGIHGLLIQVGRYHNYLCIISTIFLHFLAQNLGLPIIHEN